MALSGEQLLDKDDISKVRAFVSLQVKMHMTGCGQGEVQSFLRITRWFIQGSLLTQKSSNGAISKSLHYKSSGVGDNAARCSQMGHLDDRACYSVATSSTRVQQSFSHGGFSTWSSAYPFIPRWPRWSRATELWLRWRKLNLPGRKTQQSKFPLLREIKGFTAAVFLYLRKMASCTQFWMILTDQREAWKTHIFIFRVTGKFWQGTFNPFNLSRSFRKCMMAPGHLYVEFSTAGWPRSTQVHRLATWRWDIVLSLLMDSGLRVDGGIFPSGPLAGMFSGAVAMFSKYQKIWENEGGQK